MKKKFHKIGNHFFLDVSKCLSVVLWERLCTNAYSSQRKCIGAVRHEKDQVC